MTQSTSGKGIRSFPPFISNQGEITLWAWGDYEAALIPHFNKVYPNIKVNVEVVPSSDYVVKLQTTMASGGQMPDIALLELTPRGALMALDEWEVLNAAPYNVNPDDILDYALPLITNPKGEIVGIQEDSTMGGLAYKRNLAREYFGSSGDFSVHSSEELPEPEFWDWEPELPPDAD